MIKILILHSNDGYTERRAAVHCLSVFIVEAVKQQHVYEIVASPRMKHHNFEKPDNQAHYGAPAQKRKGKRRKY